MRAVRALLDEQAAAEITHGDHELRFARHLGQQLIAAQIEHEVLRVGGEAEGKAQLLQEERGVRGAVGKVDMHMLHAEAAEQAGEIPGIARPHGRFVTGAVALAVIVDEGTELRLEIGMLGAGIEQVRWRRVVNLRLEPIQALVAEGVRRAIQGTDFQFKPHAFERQHLGIAEGLRDDRITAEEVGDARLRRHSGAATMARCRTRANGLQLTCRWPDVRDAGGWPK